MVARHRPRFLGPIKPWSPLIDPGTVLRQTRRVAKPTTTGKVEKTRALDRAEAWEKEQAKREAREKNRLNKEENNRLILMKAAERQVWAGAKPETTTVMVVLLPRTTTAEQRPRLSSSKTDERFSKPYMHSRRSSGLHRPPRETISFSPQDSRGPSFCVCTFFPPFVQRKTCAMNTGCRSSTRQRWTPRRKINARTCK